MNYAERGYRDGRQAAIDCCFTGPPPVPYFESSKDEEDYYLEFDRGYASIDD